MPKSIAPGCNTTSPPNEARDVQLHFGVKRQSSITVMRGRAKTLEVAGVEVGDDFAGFERLQIWLGQLRAGAAATRLHHRDMGVFFVDILDLKAKLRLRAFGHGAKVVGSMVLNILTAHSWAPAC